MVLYKEGAKVKVILCACERQSARSHCTSWKKLYGLDVIKKSLRFQGKGLRNMYAYLLHVFSSL